MLTHPHAHFQTRSTRVQVGWLGLGLQSACDNRVGNSQLALTEK